MVPRGLLVALILLGAGLTGCIGGSEEPKVETATNETINTADPTGRKLLAFEETNKTEEGVGGVDHHHDYWAGRTRVTIFEKEAMMDPGPSAEGTSVVFFPPQGTTIYEGTASVEFTLTNPRRHACEPLVTVGGHFICTDYPVYLPSGVDPVADPNPPEGLMLRYKHASTTNWIDAGTFVWGVPTIIKISDPTQTDMPHATSSAWSFMVESPHPLDSTLMFDAKAEIVRAEGEIPLWPGHPLFYDEEKPSRVVVDAVQAYACDSGLSGTGCVLTDGEVMEIVPDKLISYGTRTLFVWVNVTDFQAPNPATAPGAFFLYHHNATGKTNITHSFDPVNYGIEKRELFWALPVDDGSMDSPYADGSKWGFQLGASYVPPENPLIGSCYGGCAEWTASYILTVIASSIALPEDEYHMSCLDPEDYCPGEGE